MAIELADLRKIDLFESLLPEHLKLVQGITEEVNLNAGDKVFSDGDPADRFFFILRGKVRISKQIPGVGEEALAILETGMYFGEMALIDEAPRSADAICNSNCVFGVISKQKFEDLLFMNKDLAYDMLWTFVRTLSARLREANEKMRAFLTMAGSF
jgi:CRP-like cAMP-binding protein